MNFFELQEFYKNEYPNENIQYEFDEKCLRQLEIVHTWGIPNEIHHIEFRKVKVTIGSQKPIYVDINPHRGCLTWTQIKEMVNKHQDVHIHSDVLKEAKSVSGTDEYEGMMTRLKNTTGLSRSQIEAKLPK